jgi:hypothetical protein
MYSFLAVESRLLTEPLLSNGCFIVVYFSRSLPGNGSTCHIIFVTLLSVWPYLVYVGVPSNAFVGESGLIWKELVVAYSK